MEKSGGGGQKEKKPREMNNNADRDRLLMTYNGLHSEKFDILQSDVMRLKPPRHVGGKLMEMWLAVIQKERPGFSSTEKIYVFDSDFYRRLTGPLKPLSKRTAPVSESKARHMLVEKWTKEIDIFEKDFLIFLINTGNHWTVAITCYPDGQKRKPENVGERICSPCILYFDSMGNGKSDATEIFQKLSDYLVEEFKHRVSKLSRFRKEYFRNLYPKVLQQRDGHACGFFALQYVEMFFSHPIREQQLNEVVPNRAQYDFDLLKWFPRSSAEGKRKEIFNFVVEYIHKHHPDNYDFIPSVFSQSNVSGNEPCHEETLKHNKVSFELDGSGIPMEIVTQESGVKECSPISQKQYNLSPPEENSQHPENDASQKSLGDVVLIKSLEASNVLSQQFSQMEVSCSGTSTTNEQEVEEMDMSCKSVIGKVTFSQKSEVGKVASSHASQNFMDVSISPIENASSQLNLDAKPESSQKNSGRHILNSSASIIEDDSGDELMSKISSQDYTTYDQPVVESRMVGSNKGVKLNQEKKKKKQKSAKGVAAPEKSIVFDEESSRDGGRFRTNSSDYNSFKDEEDFKDKFNTFSRGQNNTVAPLPPATNKQQHQEENEGNDVVKSPPKKKTKVATCSGANREKSQPSTSATPGISSNLPVSFVGRNIYADPVCVYIDKSDYWLVADMNQKAAKVPATSHIRFTAKFEDSRVTHFVPNLHPTFGLTLSKNLLLAITGNLKIVTLNWIEKAFRRNELYPDKLFSLNLVQIPNWPYTYGNTSAGEIRDFQVVFIKPFTVVDFSMNQKDLIEVIKSTEADVKEYHFAKVEEDYAKLQTASTLDMQKTFVVANNISGRQKECNKLFKKLLWITFHPDFILHSIWTGTCSLMAEETKQFILTSPDLVEAEIQKLNE